MSVNIPAQSGSQIRFCLHGNKAVTSGDRHAVHLLLADGALLDGAKLTEVGPQTFLCGFLLVKIEDADPKFSLWCLDPNNDKIEQF